MQDLDELHATFVEPLLSRVVEFTSHRKFVDSLKSSVDDRVCVGLARAVFLYLAVYLVISLPKMPYV